jgi:hypothetical protein
MQIEFKVPKALQDGVARYLEFGILPGSFLLAVLENDLYEAVARADAANLHALSEILAWLDEVLPEHAWGSVEAVRDHVSQFRQG